MLFLPLGKHCKAYNYLIYLPQNFKEAGYLPYNIKTLGSV